MPWLLTRAKRRRRNRLQGGRLHLGIVADIKSERWPASSRKRWPACVGIRNLDSYDNFNRAFHEAIYAATHNAFLAEQAVAIRVRLRAFRRTQLRQSGRIAHSREEHDGILTAMAQGNGDEAGRRMRAHMLNAASALGRYIRAQAE
jgi:DNA-binding GntR family transcriptional regulator